MPPPDVLRAIRVISAGANDAFGEPPGPALRLALPLPSLLLSLELDRTCCSSGSMLRGTESSGCMTLIPSYLRAETSRGHSDRTASWIWRQSSLTALKANRRETGDPVSILHELLNANGAFNVIVSARSRPCLGLLGTTVQIVRAS